ncbi:MAG: VOC family protein [Planctomycetes bacterium]|nr:VOC family protein [Planctomycetota bacterium]
MGSPLCHFEFMSNNPEKCKRFYGSVLGWEFDDRPFPGYTMIKTGSKPGGGLMKRPDQAPAACMCVYFQVDDIPATLEKVKDAGGTVVVEETEIPGVGWFAIATDPEEISFGIFKGR